MSGFIIGLVSLSTLSAQGALPARVDDDDVAVYSAPNDRSQIITTLERDTPVAVSNLPTSGYYKIRTPDGKIGWISAEVLVLYDRDNPDELLKDGSKKAVYKVGSKFDQSNFLDIRLFGGLSLFKNSELDSLAGLGSSIQNGIHFGGEIYYPVSGRWAIGLRVEQISKSGDVSDSDLNEVFAVKTSSMPVMGAVAYRFGNRKSLTVQAALLAGMGLSTKFASTAQNSASPNTIEYSAQPLTGILKVDLVYHLTENFSLAGEIGYRYLKTAQIEPGIDANGSSIYKTSGEFSPVAIDLSGAIIGAAIGLSFSI